MSGIGRRRKPNNCHPAFAQFFDIMEQYPNMRAFIRRTGYDYETVMNIRRGAKQGMRVIQFTDMANAMGYDVVLVPREDKPPHEQLSLNLEGGS